MTRLVWGQLTLGQWLLRVLLSGALALAVGVLIGLLLGCSTGHDSEWAAGQANEVCAPREGVREMRTNGERTEVWVTCNDNTAHLVDW